MSLASWVSRVQRWDPDESGELRERVFFAEGKNGRGHIKRRQRMVRRQSKNNEASAENMFYFEDSPDRRKPTRNENRADLSTSTATQMLQEYIQRSEKLKTEGNEALRRGDYAKAEKLYSEGLRCVMGNRVECRQLVSALLTNRAAAYMHQFNIPQAIIDCREAWKICPKHIRAYTRAATCYVRHGQFQKSKSILERALQMLNASDPQFRTIQEQMRLTLRLKQQTEEVSARCAEGDVDDDLLKTLEDLSDHMQCCEKVWKLEALTCLQSNKFTKLDNVFQRVQDLFHVQETTDANLHCWWQWMRMESLWWNPQHALDAVLQQIQQVLESMQSRSLTELETTPQTEALTQSVLQCLMNQTRLANVKKDAGNQAMAQRNYDQAYKRYSEAIVCCETAGSPATFLSVLYCNRGAALHGSGCYIEAMGDVCIAISLYPHYAKAYLRLAQMHVETFNAAAAGEILNACQAQCVQLSAQDSASVCSLRSTISRLERASHKLDAYKLMGLSRHCQNSAVKKAFKKLALRLHPDKAAHAVKLNLSWMKEKPPFVKAAEKHIRDALHDHMQQLFKLLNGANSALSDPLLRGKLDQDLHRTEGASHFHPNHSPSYRPYPSGPYAYYHGY